jgi:hypothetical protein
LQLEDIEIVAGSGAVPFNRKRFGGQVSNETPVKSRRTNRNLQKSISQKKG